MEVIVHAQLDIVYKITNVLDVQQVLKEMEQDVNHALAVIKI